MASRNLLLPVLLAGGVGLPLVVHQSRPTEEQLRAAAADDSWGVPGTPQNIVDRGTHEILPGMVPVSSSISFEQKLVELVSFSVTPGSIARSGQPVSQLITSDGWPALRTSVMTGSLPWDLQGTVTYVFNESEGVERVILQVRTGDPRPAVEFLTHYFAMRPVASPVTSPVTKLAARNSDGIAQRYVAHRGMSRVGVLRVDAGSAYATTGAVQSLPPTAGYRLSVELVRPQGRAGLSAEGQRWLAGN